MIQATDIPLWLAIVVSLFIVLGAGVTLIGAIGLARFRSFYERIHAPTLGTTFGAGGILIGSILYFSVLQSRPVLHELIISVAIFVTTPVTLMLLSRAVIHRDRTDDSKRLPGSSDQD